MVKKIFSIVIIILMLIGIYFGISITIKKEIPEIENKEKKNNIFSMVQQKSIQATKFYVYGRAFNVEGKIDNISKDNLEGVKLVITNGLDYEKAYNLDYEFIENELVFSVKTDMNTGIILDKLEDSD